MSDFKNSEMVFKVKQLDKERNKGARCDQSGKKPAIELLNKIIGEEKYNKENTKIWRSTLLEITLEISMQNKGNKFGLLALVLFLNKL